MLESGIHLNNIFIVIPYPVNIHKRLASTVNMLAEISTLCDDVTLWWREIRRSPVVGDVHLVHHGHGRPRPHETRRVIQSMNLLTLA